MATSQFLLKMVNNLELLSRVSACFKSLPEFTASFVFVPETIFLESLSSHLGELLFSVFSVHIEPVFSPLSAGEPSPPSAGTLKTSVCSKEEDDNPIFTVRVVFYPA